MKKSDESGFASLGLSAPLVSAVTALGYEEPTPIQREAIPVLLSGSDMLGQGWRLCASDQRVDVEVTPAIAQQVSAMDPSFKRHVDLLRHASRGDVPRIACRLTRERPTSSNAICTTALAIASP